MGDDTTNSKKLPQIICGLGAAMGGFNAGTALGWASGGMPLIKLARGDDKEEKDEPLIDPWLSAIINIGAIASLLITGVIMNRVGLKLTMLMSLPLGAAVWTVMALVMLDPVLIVMRFLIGFATGMYGVVCPVYAGEIAAKEVRGTLGVFFQLMITSGILYSYCCGLTRDFVIFNLMMIIPIVIMVVWVMFVPESPFFLVKKNKVDQAKEVLQKLRGRRYNIDPEFKEMNSFIQKSQEMENLSLSEQLRKKPIRRALGTGMLLMCCQQLCGINAVIFNMKSIFAASSGGDAKEMMDPLYQSIIVGVVQVIATLVATLVVDRLGRRMLMLVSMFFMGISHVLLFAFFLLKEIKGDDFASTISWLPLIGLCLFIASFSFGAGPIPWSMIGEIFPDEAKHVSAPVTAIVSWLLSFAVVWIYEFLSNQIPQYYFFLVFCVLCCLGVVGIFFILVETKNRTFDDIQKILEGNAPEMAPIAFKN